MIAGACIRLMLYNFFALILMILNRFGSNPKVYTPDRLRFTLSALASMSFTKI